MELEKSLVELRQTFKSGRTRSLSWRKNQLKALLQLIHDKEEFIFDALYTDLGKHSVESYRDEVLILNFVIYIYVCIYVSLIVINFVLLLCVDWDYREISY